MQSNLNQKRVVLENAIFAIVTISHKKLGGALQCAKEEEMNNSRDVRRLAAISKPAL